MKKILTIGSATQDIFILYEKPKNITIENQVYTLLPQGKVDVKEVYYSTGGGALNAAISFKRLGFDTFPYVNIGNDHAGNFILNRLKLNNISSNLINIVDYPTALSFIIPTEEKDYTALVNRGANKNLDLTKIKHDSFDVFYISGLSTGAAEQLASFVKENKTEQNLIALNPSSTQITKHFQTIFDSLQHIDILISNKSEAQKLYKSLLDLGKGQVPEPFVLSVPRYKIRFANSTRDEREVEGAIKEAYERRQDNKLNIASILLPNQNQQHSLSDYFNSLLKLGPKYIVVTDGSHGAYVATHEQIYFFPVVKAKVIGSIGAGDAFGSTFTAFLSLGNTIEDALIKASINSASVVSNVDTNQGLLTFDELESRFKEIDKSELQIFSRF